MKLMIVGHGRHGKDTVSEILSKTYGLTFTSSSLFCAERVMMPAFRRRFEAEGGPGKSTTPVYYTVEGCFQDRHNHRKFWYDEIVKYCTPDKARLFREILTRYDIYCGPRQVREFMCARNEGLFDFSIWVDRSEHQPLEGKDSMAIEPWMCDYWLDNNGTLDDLHANIHTLALTLGLEVKPGLCRDHQLVDCVLCND